MKTSSEYYIVFTNGEHKLARWFKRDYSHIKIYVKDDFQWMVIDPHVAKLSWDILPIRADTNNPWIGDAKHVMYVRTGTVTSFFGRPHMGTCVSLAKYICGLKLLAFTPWQLYKKLSKLSRNGKPLFNVFEIKQIQ